MELCRYHNIDCEYWENEDGCCLPDGVTVKYCTDKKIKEGWCDKHKQPCTDKCCNFTYSKTYCEYYKQYNNDKKIESGWWSKFRDPGVERMSEIMKEEEPLSTPYFNGIKHMDTIWVGGFGYKQVVLDFTDPYPIRVRGINNSLQKYNLEGIKEGEPIQSAFWSDPYIVVPSRPKRKVKKNIVLTQVYWGKVKEWNGFRRNMIVPNLEGPEDFDMEELVYKPPMKMTLEWEEEE